MFLSVNLLKPQPIMDKIRKYYSNKMLAVVNGRRYAEQEKQTVYLYESQTDEDCEYSLRFLSELVSLDSNCVLKEWMYHDNGTVTIRTFMKKKRPKRTAEVIDTNLPMGAQDHPEAPFND